MKEWPNIWRDLAEEAIESVSDSLALDFTPSYLTSQRRGLAEHSWYSLGDSPPGPKQPMMYGWNTVDAYI